MFRSQIKQVCPRCKGTGITSQILRDSDGNVLLAPPYLMGEGDKPQYENCAECHGEGMSLQPAPREVMIEGETFPLEEADRRARFNDVLA